MTASETIAKAIEKLEGLRDACTTEWRHQSFYWKNIGPLEGWWVAILSEKDDDPEVKGGSSEANAELIVTLHRTIDAQLAILRAGLPDPAEVFSEAGQAYHAAAAILAKAILGAHQ